MESDPLDTVIDYEEPLGKPSPMCTAGYRKKAVRMRWYIWTGIAVMFAVALTAAIVAGKWYALAPTLLLAMLAWVGGRMRFCPECDAVTHYRLGGLDLTFCA